MEWTIVLEGWTLLSFTLQNKLNVWVKYYRSRIYKVCHYGALTGITVHLGSGVCFALWSYPYCIYKIQGNRVIYCLNQLWVNILFCCIGTIDYYRTSFYRDHSFDLHQKPAQICDANDRGLYSKYYVLLGWHYPSDSWNYVLLILIDISKFQWKL